MGPDASALKTRLTGYWKMEAFNVVGLPVAIVVLVYLLGGSLGRFSIVPMLTCAVLLAIGAYYWKGKLHSLDGHPAILRSSLKTARLMKRPVQVLVFASIGIAVLAITTSGNRADRYTAVVMAVLSALEYVNYYHRQLQHFDNAADFKKLMNGRGFRRAHMARDLRRYDLTELGQ